MSHATQTTDSDFKREVLDSKIPVLVDFWAEWCGPCRMMTPLLEELSVEYDGRLKVVKLNVEENLQTTDQFQIRAMPTFLFFKGGNVVGQIIGAGPKSKFVTEIQRVLA